MSATATFLFTDIEGSTKLLKAHREEYATILADHHRLLREAFTAYGGKEVDNQGDSFFVAFSRAKDAVLAAAAAQRALAEHSWPGGAAVRVRMGIHTGEADLAVDRYVGLSVHRAARISAIGHGGQVLVSPTTAHLLDDEADLPGITLRDLGEHRLKDISRPVRLYQLDVEGLPRTFAALEVARPSDRDRRRRTALVAAVLLLAAIAAVAFALTHRDAPPPEVLPNSVVRIDPSTLQPTEVVPIGSGADLIVSAGSYLWITHHVLRDIDSGALRDAGDRTLTRVDAVTGDVTTVGGGLAPCGLAADPSGDVWVANCFASGGPTANVVRIDATTLEFEATWPAPPGDGFVRGLAYGGGSLWVSEISGGDSPPKPPHTVTQVDSQTGEQRSIRLPNEGTPLAWSGGYGDLWISSFSLGSVMRVHAATREVDIVEGVAFGPIFPVVDGDAVWVGDWEEPQLARIDAVGSHKQRTIFLPAQNRGAGVWTVDTGAGFVWATTPRDGALWRIDPESDDVTRIPMPHLPTGVAADGDDVWVTVRGR